MSAPKPLSSLITPLAKDVLGKKGVLFGRLLMEWPSIAGTDMAARATPLDVRSAKAKDKNPRQAVLHLAVTGSHAIEIQHEIPYLIEKLNVFFGYAAITGIKLVQTSAPVGSTKKRPKKTQQMRGPLPPDFEKAIASTPGDDLQEALRNFGKTLASPQNK